MKTVWGLVDRQRVFNAIEGELALLYPVRDPPHNAAEERRGTFLRAHKNTQIDRQMGPSTKSSQVQSPPKSMKTAQLL